MLEHMNDAPKIVVFDYACKLKTVALTVAAQFFWNTGLCVLPRTQTRHVARECPADAHLAVWISDWFHGSAGAGGAMKQGKKFETKSGGGHTSCSAGTLYHTWKTNAFLMLLSTSVMEEKNSWLAQMRGVYLHSSPAHWLLGLHFLLASMNATQLENSLDKLTKLAARLRLQAGGTELADKLRAVIDRAGAPPNVVGR